MQEALPRVTDPPSKNSYKSQVHVSSEHRALPRSLPVCPREIREIASLSVAARILEDPVHPPEPTATVRQHRAIIVAVSAETWLDGSRRFLLGLLKIGSVRAE